MFSVHRMKWESVSHIPQGCSANSTVGSSNKRLEDFCLKIKIKICRNKTIDADAKQKEIEKKIFNFCMEFGWHVTAADIVSCSGFVTELRWSHTSVLAPAEPSSTKSFCFSLCLSAGRGKETGRKCSHSCQPELPKGIFHAHLLSCLILTHKFACFFSSTALPHPTGNDRVALLCFAASWGQPNTLLS